jgi:aldose 1-epimerase
VTHRPFGTLPDGRPVELYVIRNNTVELRAITLGGIITSLRVPDRDGLVGDVVLGHATLAPYLNNTAYLGAIVGRYANRIARGRFRLDDVAHQLATNDGPNHLHGGIDGFDRHLWVAAPINGRDGVGVRFERTSPAGEEHYPGTLTVAVTYLVTSGNIVALQYEAETDAPTIVNLTQHTYFNLAGESSTSVLDHDLTIHADSYTPVDTTLIPTGEIAPVNGTPFDFRIPARLRAQLQRHHEQLRRAGGFDHNWVLTRTDETLTPAAELCDLSSGRRLHIATTEPGVQFYAGHLLEPGVTGAYGRTFERHAGLCLETQHFPDSPNQLQFPPATLRPRDRYMSSTTWRFAAD